jgi:putative membrane protein insertion efficiency factor
MTASISRAIRGTLMRLVRLYQRVLSPFLGPSCRFVPSCSDYALEALQRKPLFEGLALIAWRLLRCQPLCKGGFDPVPPDSPGHRPAARVEHNSNA